MIHHSQKPSNPGEPRRMVVRLFTLCIALIAVALFLPCVTADTAPLETVQTGTVSGDLYVGAFQPVAWNNQPVLSGVKEFSQQFSIPAFSNVQWARLYTEIYAAGTDNRAGRVTTRLDGNNDGTNESTWTENLATTSSPDSTVYVVNDHCNKVYSDYLTWYDVTSQVTSQNPNVFIKTENLDGSTFDGRVKMVALVVAYNDGDSDQVKYWVNQGHDYRASGASGVTTSFDTTTVPAGFTGATLKNVGLSSKDALYTFNSLTPAGADPVSPYNYFETNSWDVTRGISTGSTSIFGYTNNGGSFKTTMAALTVRYPAQPTQVDLNITAIKFPTDSNLFAHETNLVNATVKNLGTSAAGPFNVRFRINGVDTIIPVTGLAAGASLDLQVTDPSLHSAGDSVTINVMADPGNSAPEIAEGNNILEVTKTVVNNGYKGKRFTGGSDITTSKTFDLKGDLLYSAKPDYQSSGPWSAKTITWSSSDLVIPSTATIREARLYVPYNWDQNSIMPDGVSAAFNGGTVNKIASYSDTKGYGSYNIPSGLVVYNVTSQFSATGSNTATITKTSSQGGPSLNGMVLVVIFADNSRTEKLIFLNEEADILKRYSSDTWITPEEATAYAPFTGAAITTTNVNSARLITIANSAKPGEGNLVFNAHSWTGVWQGGDDNSLGTDDRSVLEYLTTTGNEAQFNAGVTGDYFMASNAILVVELKNSQPSAPVAAFSATPTSGSAPLNVAFTDASTGSITSWAWDFNNDGTVDSTAKNPTHIYSAAGSYTVNLTVTGPGGLNSIVKTNLITVNSPSETITLSVVPTSASFPLQSTRDFQLIVNTLPKGIGGYDLVITLTNPAIGKIVTGVYPSWVGLSNTSALPSSSVRMSGVDVNRQVQPGATNVTIGTITIRGDVGGTTPIVISNVNMDADSGEAIIPEIINGQATVISTITADFTANPVSGATPLAVQFTDQSTGTVASYAWDFNNDGIIESNAKNPGYTYGTAGTYSVNLTVTGPGGSSSKLRTNYISVSDQPVAPVSNFTASPTTGNGPLSVQFTDQSMGSITSYAWDFGDSGTSTLQSPQHIYSSAGTYSVNLTVNGPGGSSSKLRTNYISVSTSPVTPVAAFTAAPVIGLASLPVSFTDQSSNSPTSWNWESKSPGVGDSWTSFSTARNPTYNFSAGAYDIRLTATNAAGSNVVTKTQYLSVSSGPKPLTPVTSGTVSGDLYVGAFQPVPWNNQSSTPGLKTFTQAYTIPAHTSVQWARLTAVVYAAGTDNRSGQATVTFDGNGDGTYETALGTESLATASTSAADVYPVNDHVNKQYSDYMMWYDVTPLVNANTVNAKIVTENINGSTFDGRLKELTLVIAYNDGDQDQVKYWVNEGHDYQTSSGSAVTTTFGTSSLASGWASAELTNIMLSSKDASYTLNTVPYTGANPVSPYASFAKNTWDVRTSLNAGSNSNFVYMHAASSSFKTTLATLKVRYGTQPVAPVANFIGVPTTGDSPLSVQFTDQSTGSITSYAWDFGDSGTSTLQNPDHTYSSAGTYSVNLTVTGSGGSNSKIRTNYISASTPPIAPIANFIGLPTTGDSPLSVQFTDQSTGSITSYAWDFGDSGTSTLQNPQHTYNVAGTYSVNLTVTGSGGSNSKIRTNYISVKVSPKPTFLADFTVSPVTGTAPLTVKCTDKSIGNPTWLVYDFGDGINATGPNPTHIYRFPGVYTITLSIMKYNTTTYSVMGSTATKPNVITVSSVPLISPVAKFTASPVTGPAPLTVKFTDQSTGNPTFLNYDFGDGINATGKNPVHTYQFPGVYTVTLSVFKFDSNSGLVLSNASVLSDLIVVNGG